MIKRYFLMVFTIFLFSVSACETESKKAIPPEFVVNRVTDMYSMKDGKHFIYLSSNMNRAYDYGRVAIVEIKEDGMVSFKDSVLVPSIAGKMSVCENEETVYVTSRDLQAVTRYKIMKRDGGYKFDHLDSTDGYIPDHIKTETEPNAVIITPDGKKLFVTHIISGSLSVIDLDNWEKLSTHDLRKGVTSIVLDNLSGYYIASHRESGLISVIDTFETVNNFYLDVLEVDLGFPTQGYDMRSIKQSSDGVSLYGAFRNYAKSTTADTAPQLVNFQILTENRVEVEILFSVALRGLLGEIAVMPYSTGEEDNLVEGELIFVASPGEKTVFIVDSIQRKVIDEIEVEKDGKCDPYQLHYKKKGENHGILFVSCFIHDKILFYDIDTSSSSLYSLKGVIK